MAPQRSESSLQMTSRLGPIGAARRLPGDLEPSLVWGNPQRYWHLFLDRLQGKHFGIGGRFSAAQFEINGHTLLLKDIAKRDAETVRRFMQTGQDSILTALEKTNDPVKAQILRNLFIQLETGTVQQDVPGFANLIEIPELAHGREYLDAESIRQSAPYVRDLLQRLGNRQYGVGKITDLSDIFIQRHKRIMDQAHTKMGADWHHTFFSLTKARISSFLGTNSDRSVAEAVKEIFKETLTKSAEGYATHTANIVGDEEIAKHYYEGFAKDLADPIIGVGGRKADLSDVFVAAHEKVLEELALKDESVQRTYAKAAIDQGVEFIKAHGRTRADVSTRIFKDLIRLVSDSPVAKAMQQREKTGVGAREQTTLEPLQRYFIYKCIGQESQALGLPKSDLDLTLVKYLGDFIATRDETRTAEQIKLNQFSLVALRERLAQVQNETSLKVLNASYIASTETLSRRLEKDVDEGNLTDWLASLKLMSPQAFAELVITLGESGPLEKTHRFHPQRMAAAATPDKEQLEKMGPFYAAFNAGGKLIPKHLPAFPPDTQLAQILTDALPGKTIASFVARNDKLTGLGDKPPGPLYALNAGEELANTPAGAQWDKTRQDMFGKFAQQAIGEGGRIVRFAKGDQKHQEFAALELYTMGVMLKDNKGEDNELKNTVRNQYLDLLVDIATDVSQTTRYGETVRTAGLKVIERCLPYWPLEDQKKFVDRITTRAVLTDSAILENSHYKKILFPLAIQFNHHLPTVEGQQDNIRPIAEHIMEKTLWVLEGLPTVNGRSKRISILGTVLEFSPDELKNPELINKLASKPLNTFTKGTFPFQAIDMVAPFGTADQKTKLAQLLTTLAQADLLILAPRVSAPPRTSKEFIQAAEFLHGKVLGALDKASDIFAKTIHAISGVNEGIITGEDGSIRFPDTPPNLQLLVDRVTKAAQSELADLKQETGLAAVETRTAAAITHAINPVGEFTQNVIEQLRKATKTSPDMKMEPVLQTLKAKMALPNESSGRNSESGNQTQTMPQELLALHLAGYLLQSGLVEATDRSSASRALASIVEAVLGDRQLSKQLMVDLMQRTGVFKNFEMTAQLEQTALSAIGNQLTSQVARQAVVTQLTEDLEREKAKTAQQALALQTALTKLTTDVAAGAVQEHQAEVAHLIHTRLAAQEARFAQADKALKAYGTTMEELSTQATQVTANTLIRIVQTASDMQTWLLEISKSGGTLAQLASLYETTIGTTGVNVLVPLPTPDALLGRRGDTETPSQQQTHALSSGS